MSPRRFRPSTQVRHAPFGAYLRRRARNELVQRRLRTRTATMLNDIEAFARIPGGHLLQRRQRSRSFWEEVLWLLRRHGIWVHSHWVPGGLRPGCVFIESLLSCLEPEVPHAPPQAWL